MQKLSINPVAAASEKRCFLLYLKEKKYSLEKKKKKKERGEATSRPSDVLHHCSGTKLLLGLKKAKGNRRRAWLPPPLPIKFSKPSSAPQTARHFPERAGCYLPSTLKKYMVLRGPVATRPSTFVSYRRCTERRAGAGAVPAPARRFSRSGSATS